MDTIALKIISDINCEVIIDGELKGLAKKDQITKFHLNKGEYQVSIRSTVNPNCCQQEFIFIEYDKILKFSFRDKYLQHPEWIRDSDIRMVDHGYYHTFRNVALGIDLPGTYRTFHGMDDSDDNWTEECNRFHGGFAAVDDLDNGGCIINLYGQSIASGYKEVHLFSDDLAMVRDKNGYGFVNEKGQLVIKCPYERVRFFHEGRACVAIENKWGFIDTSGNLVIRCIYDSPGDFEKGLAVLKKAEKYGVIDQHGQTVIPFEYDSISLSGYNDVFIVKKEGKYGALGLSGRDLFPCEYDYISFYCHNSGAACIGKGADHYFINNGQKRKLGSDISTRRYSFFNNRLLRREDNGDCGWYSHKMCLCDLQGRIVTDYYDYDSYGPDDTSLLKVNKGWNWDTYYRGGGVFGFLNQNGEIQIPCKYQNANHFYEGLASVNSGGHFPPSAGFCEFVGGKWGFINESGEVIIPFLYDNAGSFYGGAALVRIGKRLLYIDKYGNEL